MLTITQKLTINGTSKINDTIAESFYGIIDVDNPEKLVLNHSVKDSDLYRDNRDECEKDANDFDDVVLALQAEMEQQDADVENLVEPDATESDTTESDTDNEAEEGEPDATESDTDNEAEEGEPE